MELWDEILELEDKLSKELDIKYTERRKVKPLLDKGLDTDVFLMHVEYMKRISEESILIYKEVKPIKDKYKQEMDEKHAKIDTLN